jgi:hypothetical protein
MPDKKASMKSKVEGVVYEDTGEEILIRFDTEKRLDAYELSLVWEEFMFWTKSIPGQNKSNPGAASPQPCPHTAGDFILHVLAEAASTDCGHGWRG